MVELWQLRFAAARCCPDRCQGIARLASSLRCPSLRFSRHLLLSVVLLALVLPSMADTGFKKKNKFLIFFPNFLKFIMFWWCVTVFGVMSVYILDHMYFKWKGPSLISWTKRFTFDGRASREAYWAQFADPSMWSMTHPILQSADVRMMQVMLEGDFVDGSAAEVKDDTEVKEDGPSKEKESPEWEHLKNPTRGPLDAAEPSKRLKPIDFKPFEAGLGLILRHKPSEDPRAGLFFCARECTALEIPKDEPWRLQMKTIEAGVGYAFLPGTEIVDVVFQASGEDGSIACEMSGGGGVNSRIWRWWMGLEKLSVEGAESMLQAINDEQGRPKKDD